jgi:hypothetical protein
MRPDRRLVGLPGLLGLALGASLLTAAPAAAANIGFKSKATLQGETSSDPTSLQFGPDGRLYVAQQNGLIKAYTVVREAPSDSTLPGIYRVTATEYH